MLGPAADPAKDGADRSLPAVLSEARFTLHGWLRGGNYDSSQGEAEFLEEALTPWRQRQSPPRARPGDPQG